MILALALLLPDALLHRPYFPEPGYTPVNSRCPMPVASVRLTAGQLPPGLRLTPRGELEGIPVSPGEFPFTLEFSDGCAVRHEVRTIRVIPAPILTAEAEVLDFHCPFNAPDYPGGIVRVSGSVPGRPYRAEVLYPEAKGDPWLKVSMRDGAIPSEGQALESDLLLLSIHPGRLPEGTYLARLRVSTWQGANTPELEFRLRIDTAQSVFAKLTAFKSPVSILEPVLAPPSVQTISPPRIPQTGAPVFPKHQPRPKPAAKPGPPAGRSSSRSRVLPFPKVIIQSPATTAAPAKTLVQSHAKGPTPTPSKPKEPPPARTKPSAMPPPAKGH